MEIRESSYRLHKRSRIRNQENYEKDGEEEQEKQNEENQSEEEGVVKTVARR